MSYEISFFYCEKNDDGSYSDETKEFKKTAGDKFEEVSLEDLFQVIIKQLSRRDILVKDVKIFEFVKKEISFRETKGGIVIKNKKFTLDNDANVIVQEIREESTTQLPIPVVTRNEIINRNEVGSSPASPLITINPNSRPIKFVTLDPDPQTLIKVKASGLAFKADKRYPVYREAPHPKQLGVMIYTMLDDNNREVTVMDHYFVNADQFLKNGFNSAVDKSVGPKLSYGNYENMDVPDIRGR